MAKHALKFEKEHYDCPTYSGWSLKEFEEVAKSYANEFGCPVENIAFSIDYGRSYYDSIEIELKVIGYRLETDEEEQQRMADEKTAAENKKLDEEKAARKKEANELAIFKRLKKKYG